MTTESVPSREQMLVEPILWNGSQVQCETPDKPDSARLFYETNLGGPIESVSVDSQVVALFGGGEARSYTAEIKLSEESNPGMFDVMPNNKTDAVKNFMGGVKGSSFVPRDGRDQDLKISKTRHQDVFLTKHDRGAETAVWVDAKNNRIVVTNNINMSDGRQWSHHNLVVTPRPTNEVDDAENAEGFFKTFMRTLDYTSGMSRPMNKDARLNRAYEMSEISSTAHSKVDDLSEIGALVVNLTAGVPAIFGNRTQEKSTKDTAAIEVIEPSINLDDIGGQPLAKQAVKEFKNVFDNPELSKKWHVQPPHGLLLHGLPGNGKTMIAEAMAAELKAKFMPIKGSELYGKYIGESEKISKPYLTRRRISMAV